MNISLNEKVLLLSEVTNIFAIFHRFLIVKNIDLCHNFLFINKCEFKVHRLNRNYIVV